MAEALSPKPNWKCWLPRSQDYFRVWRPMFTPKSFMTIYALVAVVFYALGGGVVAASNNVIEYTQNYGNCTDSRCFVTFDVQEDMSSPVFLYYQLSNTYQNHRLYMKSRDASQLTGQNRSESDVSSTCTDVTEVKDLWNKGSVVVSDSSVANPCGLIANSFFNDTYTFYPENLIILDYEISWYEDDTRFGRLDENQWYKSQWTDVENGEDYAEHFSVWMRSAATSNLKKLYGRIEQTILKGNHTLSIQNNYNATSWNGNKAVTLSTSSAFGGKNFLLGYLLIAVASVATIELFIIAFFFRKSNNDGFFPDLVPESQSSIDADRGEFRSFQHGDDNGGREIVRPDNE